MFNSNKYCNLVILNLIFVFQLYAIDIEKRQLSVTMCKAHPMEGVLLFYKKNNKKQVYHWSVGVGCPV